jgi:hypothetical protein
VFYAEAVRTLAQAELAIETARRAARGEIGRLSIGFLGSATSAFLPELVRKFRATYPGVKLTLQGLTPVQQDPEFENGEIDIGFTRTLTAEQSRTFSSRVLYRDPLMAVLPRSRRVKSKRVRVADLANESFILFHREGYPGLFDTTIAMCQKAGFYPRDVAKVMRWVKASAVDENGDQFYPTKWNYEFADIPVVENQHTPMFTGEEITKIIAKAEKQERVIYVLFAASGLRAGELFGLEVKHFNGDTITVAQSVWEGRVQTPKTVNALRQVDLHPTVAAMLRDFIGDRKQGFLFRTRTGTPFLQSNFLRSSLYPILEELGIEKQGFHGFRRFRVTHLESSCVPPALVKYWTGHAKSSDGEIVRQTVTDKYIKMGKDTKFRADVAERIGLGFELPKAKTVEVVPSVPRFQETEVTASI